VLQTVFEDVPAKETQVVIKGTTYHMRLYTAYDVCNFEEKYGISFFMDGIKKRPTALLTEIAYALLDGIKTDYPVLDDFRKALDENEVKSSKIIDATFAAVGKFLTVKEVQSDSDATFQAQRNASGNGKGNLLSKALSWIFKSGNKKS